MATTQNLNKFRSLINNLLKEYGGFVGFGNSFPEEYTTTFHPTDENDLKDLWFQLHTGNIDDLHNYLGGKENRAFQIFLIQSGTVIENEEGKWVFKIPNKFPNEESFVQYVADNFSDAPIELDEINVLRNTPGHKPSASENEKRQEIWNQIDMQMGNDMDSLPYNEIIDIANENGVEPEYVAELQGAYLIHRSKERINELREAIQDIIKEHENEITVQQAWQYFLDLNYLMDLPWVEKKQFENVFKELTTNPNQLSLFGNEQ